MWTGAGMLAALCLVFGVAPFLVIPAVVDAAGSVTRLHLTEPLDHGWQIGLPGVPGMLAPALLALGLVVCGGLVALARRLVQRGPVRLTEAWGCGRELQTARMEYTATSFGEPLTRVFEDVLNPSHDIDVSHIAESRYYTEAAVIHTSLDDAFERRIYRPADRGLRALGRHRPSCTERQRAPVPGLRPRGADHRPGGAGVSSGWSPVSMAAVSLLQVILVVLGGPLLLGLMRKVRCRMEGRVGPPIRQPLLDLRKLARRERTRPEHASWVFPLAPVVLVASTLVIVIIAPLLATDPAFGWSADLFAVVFLLLLGSVFLALGGLDTGTAFGGMGASRAMTIGALAEPALLVAILALSVPARSSNLPAIITRSLAHPAWLATPQRVLALVAFVIVIIAEADGCPSTTRARTWSSR